MGEYGRGGGEWGTCFFVSQGVPRGGDGRPEGVDVRGAVEYAREAEQAGGYHVLFLERERLPHVASQCVQALEKEPSASSPSAGVRGDAHEKMGRDGVRGGGPLVPHRAKYDAHRQARTPGGSHGSWSSQDPCMGGDGWASVQDEKENEGVEIIFF